ncbi:MAG: hypothetical protein FWG94_09290 [Oscillospiraceae bacterium]|nr:hypothetical protein [Oscillospiraceae bacterium]
MEDWIVYNIIIGLCVLILAAICLWALKRKTPMHFWAGTTVDPEEIADIKSYNKANAVMWFCYCIPFVASMFIAPFSVGAAAIIMTVGAMGGIPVLIVVYKKIYSKYKKQTGRTTPGQI